MYFAIAPKKILQKAEHAGGGVRPDLPTKTQDFDQKQSNTWFFDMKPILNEQKFNFVYCRWYQSILGFEK